MDRYHDSMIPEDVVQFLIRFQSVILSSDYGDYDEQIEDIQDYYENHWNRMSEKYYRKN